ncbi:biotin-dependent carboxyltransferase family protein [Simiduia sp. 21SJ11W-1]|uniref:5-oxoprolinase subunit C family protein n=1 Tax=Simiduia sp. 21SJ11W-1 TaxID=2909669 RepID=UPI0020A20C31|nr:biotin-dependent carboxyltransferase family protein [Simiduia sp. 21SJ11W-1]UTA47834.1 biotin-dependent carboxyltransferase family protein [Simiduia sp. 21SJ11W-1]
MSSDNTSTNTQAHTQPHATLVKPGVLALLMDAGRFGQHGLGLTTGGPLDAEAFFWANALVGNAPEATAIEVSVGGLELRADTPLTLAVTGAQMPLSIDGKPQPLWQSHRVPAGSLVKLAFAESGARAYLAVAGGFAVAPEFGSTATVVRESIGGLDGKALGAGTTLPLNPPADAPALARLPEPLRPEYATTPTLRVLEGYQVAHFSTAQRALFYSNEYSLSQQCDRMGFRLSGPALKCALGGIVSEGICLGAIQVPADGQPIILLNDRQTIGGYPKIGSVFTGDLHLLAQLMPGAKVRFAPMDAACAHAELLLAERRRQQALKQLETPS